MSEVKQLPLLGKTVTGYRIDKGGDFIRETDEDWGDSVVFTCEDKSMWLFYHQQDCCESVVLLDVCGELQHLMGHPLLMAEEVVTVEPPGEWGDSITHTFYKFATVRGYVTMLWRGESNGYYGEGVTLKEIGKLPRF